MGMSASGILEAPVVESIHSTGRYEEQDFRSLYEQEYRAHQQTKAELQRTRDHVAYLDIKIQKLEGDIAFLKKLLFSKKTEKHKPASTPASFEPKTSPQKHGAQAGHTGHPRKIPFHLPMQDVLHALPEHACVCPCCGLPLEELQSEEVSYEVSVEIHYILRRHRRKKYRKTCACPHPIVTAPAPLKLFSGGLYSMEFWIMVLVNKYAHGLPLSRQVVMMRMEGLIISEGVLCEGVMNTALLLRSLYDLLVENIAFEKLVHADETRWWNWAACYQLEQPLKQHWLWGFFSPRFHVFVIAPSRGANVVKDTLGQGEQQTIVPTLVCDRYRAYQSVGSTLAYCWAHVRRDFLALQLKYPGQQAVLDWAKTWLQLIADLYALNRLRLQYRDNPAQFEAYQQQLLAVLERMQQLMNTSSSHAAQIAQVKSMQHHWIGLTRFMDDPDIPLDNNLAERELRTPVVGRKNFYGTHSDQATEATAIAYSILSTCKLRRIDPKKFLKRFLTAYVLCRDSPMTRDQLKDFLPDRYAQLHPDDLLPV